MPRNSLAKYDEKLHPNLIYELTKSGHTQREVSELIGISTQALQKWFEKYPIVRRSWEKGKFEDTQEVENSLKAVCLPHKLTTVVKDGQGNIVSTITKDCPPNTHAMSLYLRANLPFKYVNKQEVVQSSNNPITLSNLITPEDKDV